MRWGILGTGSMAAEMASTIAHTPGAELYGVASRSAAKAKEFADKHGTIRHFTDYSALVESQVDVVYIATPPAFHCEHSCSCLAAGKAVLCEKPFAVNALEARKMVELAEKQNVFLMEAMWTRFLPSVVKLRELLQQGAIGDCQLLIAGGAYFPSEPPEHYLFRPELGGGVMLDAGIYLVSMASMILGQPSAVHAAGHHAVSGVDDHNAVLMNHSSGALAQLFVSHRASMAPTLRVLGSGGDIELAAPVFCPPGLVLSQQGKPAKHIELDAGDYPYRYQLLEVQKCMDDGATQSAVMPWSESVAIMASMDEIRRQISLGNQA